MNNLRSVHRGVSQKVCLCKYSKIEQGYITPTPMYLYWIVSDVVEARSLVMRILTMLKRKMKLICGEIKQSTVSFFIKVQQCLHHSFLQCGAA